MIRKYELLHKAGYQTRGQMMKLCKEKHNAVISMICEHAYMKDNYSNQLELNEYSISDNET